RFEYRRSSPRLSRHFRIDESQRGFLIRSRPFDGRGKLYQPALWDRRHSALEALAASDLPLIRGPFRVYLGSQRFAPGNRWRNAVRLLPLRRLPVRAALVLGEPV